MTSPAYEEASSNLGRLVRLDPREIWPNEANDFTPWLLENGDLLGDALGLEIELTDREHEVGDYYLDLIGEDLTNDCPLVVENQLSRTDHSHLGQLLTYAAGTDAKTVVWVAPTFREEHRQAIDFLNALAESGARFFAVELHVVRIGGSEPAPLLNVVAKPNDWHAAASASTRAARTGSVKGHLYAAFWQKALNAARELEPSISGDRKIGARHWLTIERPTPLAKIGFAFARSERLRVELYIYRGTPAANLELFHRLFREKDSIEAQIGSSLSWEELAGKRACRIALYRDGGVQNEDRHDEYVAWLVDGLQKFREVFNREMLDSDGIYDR